MRRVLLPQQLLCAVLPARLQGSVPCAVQHRLALPDTVLLHIPLDLQSTAMSLCTMIATEWTFSPATALELTQQKLPICPSCRQQHSLSRSAHQ